MSKVTMIQYKVLCDCRVGGFFRRKGEVISLPKAEKPFSFLKAIEADASEKKNEDKQPTKKAKKASENIITKEDLGLGKPTPSSDLTSSDMVTK